MFKKTELKSFGTLVLILMLASACFAEGGVLELRVSDAVELALAQNLNFQLATLDWQAARAKLERAHIVGDEEMLREAEKEWEDADKAYAEKKQELKSLVRTSYQQLLESENMVQHAKTAQKRAESQLAMDENKFRAGLLSSLDIERAQNSLFDASHRYEKAIVDLETQAMRFNEILGLPFGQKVVLTERLLLDFVPFTLDLATCYDLALPLDSAVIAAKEALHKAQETVLVARSPFTPRVELEQALVNEEKAEIRLQQAEQALYFRIRTDFYALLDLAHSLELADRNLELERQALKAEESKYAAGVVSNAQIVAQQENLAKMEQDYSSSLLNYSLARIKLLQAIGQYEEAGESNGN
ncbi:MAG: TolC family protein [Firmicutes bacterium]|nr:TolC family protein [Bacillota bacterium]